MRLRWKLSAEERTTLQAGQCDLLYFDESGFSPNPPLQYGWAPIGHSRCAEAGVHRQRVNVLGALGHDGKRLWAIKEQRNGQRVAPDTSKYGALARPGNNARRAPPRVLLHHKIEETKCV
ncbi:transposase [Massilia antarctica]|uniref:Transposase n=1 Tax=Massilia antarctica TaxID=2765360 RepID=A0AA48WFV8_9BURK|nr:transposase [Massilia antarctica]QPI51627.1 transposase [Massilia antarctica]